MSHGEVRYTSKDLEFSHFISRHMGHMCGNGYEGCGILVGGRESWIGLNLGIWAH